ncbi:hypothetical protein NDU88_000082 [Pleurodeles waltl]|uniref:Uncharacterized protein n=1 Tax=Pleurodeles waltl TaxID=8319 RepID=A0AAV7U6F8_PLEWA|nr:hypothetical protein NDU88_000082 [Pleurodeles waltl]
MPGTGTSTRETESLGQSSRKQKPGTGTSAGETESLGESSSNRCLALGLVPGRRRTWDRARVSDAWHWV